MNTVSREFDAKRHSFARHFFEITNQRMQSRKRNALNTRVRELDTKLNGGGAAMAFSKNAVANESMIQS